MNELTLQIDVSGKKHLYEQIYEYIKNVNYPNSSTNFTIDTTFVNLNLEYSHRSFQFL